MSAITYTLTINDDFMNGVFIGWMAGCATFYFLMSRKLK